MKEGMTKMKFALNHSFKFDRNRYGVAFFAGLLQSVMVILVTCLNYYIIIALSNEIIDVAKDFLALMVISDFDNMLYLEHSKDEFSK